MGKLRDNLKASTRESKGWSGNGGVSILVSGASPGLVPRLIRSFAWQTPHLIKEIKALRLTSPSKAIPVNH